MKSYLNTALALSSLTFIAPAVMADASFQADNAYGTKTAFAGKSYYATLNMGHGCEDLDGNHHDTIRVEVTIPTGFTAVRPSDAAFGKASVVKDDAGNVTKLVWKTAAAATNDDFLYQVTFKGTLPATPLATLSFPTTQFCANDTIQVWEGTDSPKLLVLPARKPGWNKYTAQSDISLDTIKSFFGDAIIVWSEGDGWSSNPVTDALIADKLTGITTGSVYWVKY